MTARFMFFYKPGVTEAEDYSGVRDPDALRSFQLATAYYLTCSEDSSEGDFDPSRECFMADLADEQNDNARATTRTAGLTRRQTHRWCRLQPLLRQARRRDKLS